MTKERLNLILNASEGILQIVVGDSAQVLAHQEWDCPKNGTEKLVPYIKDMMCALEISLDKISRISSVIGAGSFTGIRLCLSTSAALSRVLNTEQVAIDFLHALSFNAPTKQRTHTRVITHAKKNLVHCADFVCDLNEFPVQQGATRLIAPNEAIMSPLPHFLLGSGVQKISDLPKDISTTILQANANILNPRVLLFLANTLEVCENDPSPEYVRACDAVDNLEHISQKLGNNSEAAFAKLEEITSKK